MTSNSPTAPSEISSERIVLSAQAGRNAVVLRQVLEKHGFVCLNSPTVQAVAEAICDEAALVVLTEEVLVTENTARQLIEYLNQQPEWSDIPVILLLKDCQRFPACLSFVHTLNYVGSLVLLETPIKPHVFISVVQSCLQNRRRQYALRDTLQQLRESNQTLEDFCHTAAHELRSPLGIVQTSLNMLSYNFSEEKRQRFLQLGQRNAANLDRTLTALLEYGKLKSRSRNIFEPVDMQAVLDNAVADLQPLIAERNADVSWTELPTVYGNYSLLSQLVGNLIKNAIVHNSAEIPTVHISAQELADIWQFQVLDNGLGIPTEDLEKIFVLFHRSHQSLTPGSGIGLALCRRIIDRHEGRLWVSSEPGQGSTFYFELPISEAPIDDQT
ncbi:ATP-binding protein [Sphaerothrix gracilis]|uniref:ATP-binding protein n=1 Tax=Sphaerothrix gracilis TaxID=3151835 RepID=UPI0031FDC6BB